MSADAVVVTAAVTTTDTRGVALVCQRLLFTLTPRTLIRFPNWKAANTLRGAFGHALAQIAPGLYEQIFIPHNHNGPSGLQQSPRPFVLRARELNGRRFERGENFHFSILLFDPSTNVRTAICDAIKLAAKIGIGPLQGRAETDVLLSSPEIIWPQRALSQDSTITLSFLSPTELSKEGSRDDFEFGFLFRRLRDRVSNLAKYSDYPAPVIDYRELGEQAKFIALTYSKLHCINTRRRSSRTQQIHTLGGYMGEVTYSGNLTPFQPYLQAGVWTGIGRHAVWGNGEYEVRMLEKAANPG